MGNWLYTLDVMEIKRLGKERSITPKEWANKLAQAIKNQLPVLCEHDSELDQIVFDLEYDVDENASWDDTDEILETLYDWADYNRCWVKSF